MDNIQRFFSDLDGRMTMLRRHRENVHRVTAEGFNLVEQLRPNEYRHSELIALLLNPKGEHGQGQAFLEVFLSRLSGLPAARAFQAAIERGVQPHIKLEAMTRSLRRVDLVLTAGEIAIGTENKPFAAAQTEQLKDYASDLGARFPKGWALLYISGTGEPPPEESLPTSLRNQLLEQGNYIEWDYKMGLAGWLYSLAEKCDSDKMRWFLRDYTSYVKAAFD